MGFYGNITDTSRTHFQFDQIFPNRTAMDQAAAAGTDNIFSGRFVLVKYDPDSSFFAGDIPTAYYNNEHMYLDNAYTIPLVYTTFSGPVSSPTSDNWDLYYLRQGNYYNKLPNENYFYDNENNYYIANASSENITYQGQIIRARSANGQPTQNYYICTNGTLDEIATFEAVVSENNLSPYFTNYFIDKEHYNNDFDIRGYDATVWQKIYNEGHGKFILIAYLNGLVPGIELIADAPTIEPSAAYISTKSDALYTVHVPGHWGFKIKETLDLDKSDVIENNKNLAIYMNLGTNNVLGQNLYHINESHVDNTTINKISLTPTGKSGTLYDGQEKEDIQELSINLPIVGNLIDKGYDLIYGPGHEVTINNEVKNIRSRDIDWYEADEEVLKQDGRTELGGKTYNLSSLAGIINTMHTQLGQIIKTLPTRPANNALPQYSSNYIYYIEDEEKYFRIAPSYQYTVLTNADYNFSAINYDPVTYVTDTYYILDNGNYVISTGIEDPSNPPQLYQKSIREEMYHEVTNLIPYIQSHYFIKQGTDYIRDNAALPSYAFYPDGQYYDIVETTSFPGATSFPGGEYQAGAYRYIENNNYYLDMSDIATEDREYYWNIQGTYNNNVLLYMKNKFYYLNPDTGGYTLCTYNTLADAQEALGRNAQLYWLEFDETIDTIVSVEVNGVIQTYIGHPLKENGIHALPETLIGMINPPIDTSNFYCIQGNDYIAYSNMNYETKTIDGVPLYAVKNSYITIDSVELVGDLYVTGKYYYIDSNGSYIKAMSSLDRNLTYYLIDIINSLTNPFYVPNKYFYESSENYFEIDITNSLTPGRRYYTAEKLYVIADYTGRCPYGYEWSNYSVFVPASITLGRRADGKQFIEIIDFMKNGVSINSDLLQLEKYLETDNADTRDKNTVRGALNQIQDALFVLDRLVPRQMLFVNDFGQITSSTINYSKLLDIVGKYNEIMAL